MLTDIHPDAEAVLVELWRKKTPAERFARTCELTQIDRENSRRKIQDAYPDASLDEVNLRLVELYYGRALADDVREYLKRRSI